MTRNALIVHNGQDLAGIGIRTKQAFDAAPELGWFVQSVHSTETYIAYPTDVRFRFPVVARLYDDADVLHLNQTLVQYERLDNRQGKPAILHHHGTEYRRHHARTSAEARRLGMAEVASTLDLTMLEPGVTWLPAPYDLEALADLRERRYVPGDVIRIAHAPTNRAVKSTALVIATVARLRDRGLPVELLLIEGRSWRDCLRVKATADVFVDQLLLGYGCNALEAWGMGIPVIAGAADPAVRARMLETLGELPFLEATEATLEAAIVHAVTDADVRIEYAQRGSDYVWRWHDAETVARRTAELYEAAGPTLGSRRRRKAIPPTAREQRVIARRGVAGVSLRKDTVPTGASA